MWGVLVKDNNPTESVHLFACKRFLNVAAHTPKRMVYGELGRHPLQINCYIRAIKYWFRLLKTNSERLPNQAYRMLMNLDSNGKYNWASSIRSVLQSLGFGYVWLAQGVTRENCFLRMFLCFKCSMYNDIRPNVMKNIEPYQESAQLARLMYSRDDGIIRKIA